MKSDQFVHQKKPCARVELDDQPVTVTTTVGSTTYRGQEYETIKARWKGCHLLRIGEEEFLVDESMTFDAGPRLGVTLVFERHREVPFTEEECAAGRAHILRVATDVLVGQGIW